jgi:RHS repeat-associated protein
MTTTKKYDFLNRLVDITSVPSAASAVKFLYAHNDANQRVRRTDSDDSYWSYEYDGLGQVASGKHFWPDSTPVAGQQFEYAYDDIGNRRRTKEGGDAYGAGLRTAHYTVNNLNQYTQRDVPGAADIIGIAHPSASASVNAQSGYRHGEYYHKELAIDNASALIWQPVTNQAIYNGQTNITTGNLLLPKTPQIFWYDNDGNTLSDFVWTNVWDGENRMLATENTTVVPSTGRAKEAWTFDGEGRWIQRVTYSWNGILYLPQSTNRFLWDGRLLLGTLDHTSTLLNSLMRGLDLDGSLEDSGGVGDLLAVNVSDGLHFCSYDANGNVVGLASATSGALSASYEFDPFAKAIRITGLIGRNNPIRFSTQFTTDTSGDLKYLYRNAQPSLGRWLTVDPLHELGFQLSRAHEKQVPRCLLAVENAYGFLNNDVPNEIDRFGLTCCFTTHGAGAPGLSAGLPCTLALPGTPTMVQRLKCAWFATCTYSCVIGTIVSSTPWGTGPCPPPFVSGAPFLRNAQFFVGLSTGPVAPPFTCPATATFNPITDPFCF